MINCNSKIAHLVVQPFQIACYILNHTPAFKSVTVTSIFCSLSETHWHKQIHPNDYIYPGTQSDFSDYLVTEKKADTQNNFRIMSLLLQKERVFVYQYLIELKL